ncbi:MAG: hypothetical protein ACJAWL_003502, partial [Motiliproteus sp.]
DLCSDKESEAKAAPGHCLQGRRYAVVVGN